MIARWFGEWDEVNGTAWQSAVIGKSTVARAEEVRRFLERPAQGNVKTPAGPAFAVDAVPFPLPPTVPQPRRAAAGCAHPSSAYDQRSAMLFLAPMIAVLMTVAVFPCCIPSGSACST